MKKIIECVIPCFNEEECISLMYEALKDVAKEVNDYEIKMLFVDDGSKDHTLQEIKKLENLDTTDCVHHISFSRNFGKESAIYAGLSSSMADYVVLMDADLQHPPKLIPEMIKSIEEGFECCGARRTSRTGEPPIRSAFSRLFYKIMSKGMSIQMRQGETDFRMMTRKYVDSVMSLCEKNRFTKGLFSWVGYKIQWLEYENVERAAGTTKWSFRGLFSYAASGFMAFATAPLRGAVYLGFLVMIGAFIYAIYIFISTLFGSGNRTGYASMLIVTLFLGGIIIMLLGIIGEYLARIYLEVKNRPIYLVEDTNIKGDL